MKRLGLLNRAIIAAILLSTRASAQSSVEILQKELDQIKQDHEESTSKNLDYFLSSLQTASGAPDAAQKLYEAAGGKAPDLAKVITKYEHETPSEESARTAVDRAVLGTFDNTLQLHCGMMRFAALFIAEPKLPALQDDWNTWLKGAAQAYPQIMGPVGDSRVNPRADNDVHGRGRHKDAALPAPRPDVAGPIRNMPMRDSPIGGFLGFHGWSDKPQGGWRVADLPAIYHDTILMPLRKTPNAETLAAWDIYIAMMNASQTDADKWADIDAPGFEFDRSCDDYTATPATEKLEALIALIKAHSDHPKFEEWIDRVHDLLQSYPGQKSATVAIPPAKPGLPPIQPDQPPPPAVGLPTAR